MGGTHKEAVLGGKLPAHSLQYIKMEKAVVDNTFDRDALTLAPVEHWKWERHNRTIRADLYDELNKLPLRFAMHPFSVVQQAMEKSAVGYAAPLGPADPIDTIPFHIHRGPDGTFIHEFHSMRTRIQHPRMVLNIRGVEGDSFRFEDELIKILPTFKIFVKPGCIDVYGATNDVVEILEHWYIGLGF